jgi:hypothetical protein
MPVLLKYYKKLHLREFHCTLNMYQISKPLKLSFLHNYKHIILLVILKYYV